MNLIISFSGRDSGNCDQICGYISKKEDKIVYFRDLDVHNCSNCDYECFSKDECKYSSDPIFDLYDSMTFCNKVFLVVPIYCGNPSSLYFVFKERGQGYFCQKPLNYEHIIKRLYVIGVYGNSEDAVNYLSILKDWFKFTMYDNHFLGIERHKYNLKLNESVLSVESICKKLDEFILRENKLSYADFEFRRPEEKDIPAINSFKEEFLQSVSAMDGSGNLIDVSAEAWLGYNKAMEHAKGSETRSLQMGLFVKESGQLLGLIQLKVDPQGYLLEFGGNISFCVRPSERGKGYAKYMLNEILKWCKVLQMKKALIICFEDNLAAESVIKSCGGIYEKTTHDYLYSKSAKLYWIYL